MQDAYRAGALARWAVELRATGEFVGWAGLKLNHEPVNGRTDFVDLGYRLLEPHWGQGYGTEAGRAWLAQGFGALALPLVASYAEATHGASRRILEKVWLEFINLFDTADGRPHAWYEAPNPARAR
ncbi:GNAT family N-acetyltransferase [Hymenobacter nivis]|uniref:GNAT family N-acetyltransferase n=1 Tax=Hymenobacter nivis TaxID=1850093 RepID=UPI0013757AA4|nr:GNAT family N-acetyltransferase [Hymenobacter nivis]